MTTPDLYEAVRLASSLAPLLGGWTFVAPPPGIATMSLTHPDGRRILVTLMQGRAVFAAQPPPGRCEWRPLVISIRADRGHDVIARELMRRLLPRYGAAYQDAAAEARTNEVESARARAGREATADLLADLLASLTPLHRVRVCHPAADNRASVSWSSGVDGPTGVGDVHINHDGTVVTELRIRWLPAQAAARVLAALTQETP